MFNWVNFSNPVALWWLFLVIFSVINITVWSWTRLYLFKNLTIKKFNFFHLVPENLIWFSGIYVFGCAYRSFFTKADVQRICLFDTWFSSVMCGRTIATIAEIAFIIQWSIVIKFLGNTTNDHVVKKLAQFIVPLILIAECFSWYAVITTHYLGNTIEESLWTVTYTLILVCLIRLWPKFKGAFKYAITISIVSSFLYILFMIFVDVHMYFTRWQADLASQKRTLGFIEGIIDLNTKWIVTYDINLWRTEIPWMSLYFSFAVLVSIGLCYIPMNHHGIKKHLL